MLEKIVKQVTNDNNKSCHFDDEGREIFIKKKKRFLIRASFEMTKQI